MTFDGLPSYPAQNRYHLLHVFERTACLTSLLDINMDNSINVPKIEMRQLSDLAKIRPVERSN